ncbi:hypothetical protein [Marinobacter sp. NFXS9]|uniref:hypothetical protein n=1 Tax=Marinobacter sp. NFXS9 TaxID=2818433 RepID=UPI0032DF0752
MSYRLASVEELPRSSDALVTLVHPQSAVDIVKRILNPHAVTDTPIENLDPRQKPSRLIEQLAQGEQILFDASGASPGVFLNRRPESGSTVANLPPRLAQALDDHWEGRTSSGIGGAPLQGDSLAPAAEPAYKAPPPQNTPTESGQRTLDLLYRWPDGSGVAGAPFAVTGLNDFRSGTLDDQGQAQVTGLLDPVVDVRFGDPAPAGSIALLRQQLQAQLDAMVSRERREAARLDASTADLPLTFNAGVHVVFGLKGLWESAVGFVHTAAAVGNLTPMQQFRHALKAAWDATLDGSDQAWVNDFKQRFDEANKAALVEALGFDPADIRWEDLTEAYEITALLLDDPESRDMLGRFAVEFAQVQDSTEISFSAGGLGFDVVLGILLAAATGGAGAVASAPRYLKKLAPLAAPLRNLAKRLKIARQTRYHYSVATDGRCESVCRPRPEGPELKERSLASRRLIVNSLEDAVTALKAARQRLLAQGGFTPKYTQEELLQLAQEGLDNDRFIVRLVETHHVDGYKKPEGAMAGTLGRPGADGTVRYWSTTLDQIEPSDTCPKLIAEQLGIEYKPDANYKLAIIDREAAIKQADARTIIPTFDNLKAFAREKLDGYTELDGLLDEVMTPEYQAKYEALVKDMRDDEWSSPRVRRRHLKNRGLNSDEINAFEIRLRIQRDTGANEHFLGNGLTKHTAFSSDNRVYGALETLTYEKNPKTFDYMTNSGKGGNDAYVELVDLVPIDFGA